MGSGGGFFPDLGPHVLKLFYTAQNEVVLELRWQCLVDEEFDKLGMDWSRAGNERLSMGW